MPVETIITEYEKQKEIIYTALAKQEELIEKLRTANETEYDWISVNEASRIVKVSIPTIYRFINEGRFKKIKHFGAKKFLSKSELYAFDEKYNG